MSTEQRHGHSSLNNQPERGAARLTGARISSTSTGITGGENDSEGSIPKETVKSDAPVDKHGDTWGGGTSFQNKQVK